MFSQTNRLAIHRRALFQDCSKSLYCIPPIYFKDKQKYFHFILIHCRDPAVRYWPATVVCNRILALSFLDNGDGVMPPPYHGSVPMLIKRSASIQLSSTPATFRTYELRLAAKSCNRQPWAAHQIRSDTRQKACWEFGKPHAITQCSIQGVALKIISLLSKIYLMQ